MVPLQKNSTQKLAKDKNHQKVRDYCHIAHSICNLKFNIPNKIPAVFHNGSNQNHHFIMKELAIKFKGQLECLGENTEKYKNVFSANRKRNQKSC